MMPTATPSRFGFRFGNPELPNEFAHPPLAEVSLGVEFVASSGFSDLKDQNWRQMLGPEWPGSSQTVHASERHLPGMASVEYQLYNLMSDRAIRFSGNGFSFGWLGHDGSVYPRYEAIRDGFVATLDAIRLKLPEIGSPIRTTVSYSNRIPRGTVWTTSRDLSFFRLWQPNPLHRLKIEPEGFAARWQFPLEAERGILTVEVNHQPPVDDHDVEAVWLTITSSSPTDSDDASLFDGLDYGREMVVRSFSELVTTEAKTYWGVLPRKS